MLIQEMHTCSISDYGQIYQMPMQRIATQPFVKFWHPIDKDSKKYYSLIRLVFLHSELY